MTLDAIERKAQLDTSSNKHRYRPAFAKHTMTLMIDDLNICMMV